MTAAKSQGSETCEVGGEKNNLMAILCQGQTWEKRRYSAT